MPQFPTLGPVSNALGHLVKFQHKKEGGKFQIASAFQGTLVGWNGGHMSGACASARSWGAGLEETQCLRSRDGLCQGKLQTPQADTDRAQRQCPGESHTLASSGSTSHLASPGDAGSRLDFVSKAPAPPRCKPQRQPPRNSPTLVEPLLHGKREEEAGRLTPHGAFSRDTSSSARGFWLPPAWR